MQTTDVEKANYAEIQYDSVPVSPEEDLEPLGSSYLLTKKVIGRGAMGRVYLGYQRNPREPVAVKILHPHLADDPEVVSRFLQQRSVITGFVSPYLVNVRDLVVEAGRASIVMDLIEGIDLRRLLSEPHVLSETEAVFVTSQVLSALETIHSATPPIVHRDVKPENILLDQLGNSHLTDFGIAKIMSTPTITRLTGPIGTPDYMAPELIEGREVSPAADVYSLGILLFEILSGHTPFFGENPVAVARRIVEEIPQKPPNISVELWRVLSRMIEKNPRLRPSATEAKSLLLAGRSADFGDSADALATTVRELSIIVAPHSANSSGTGVSPEGEVRVPLEGRGPISSSDTIVSRRFTRDPTPDEDVPPMADEEPQTTTRRARRSVLILVVAVTVVAIVGTAFAAIGGLGGKSKNLMSVTFRLMNTPQKWSAEIQLTSPSDSVHRIAGVETITNPFNFTAVVNDVLVLPTSLENFKTIAFDVPTGTRVAAGEFRISRRLTGHESVRVGFSVLVPQSAMISRNFFSEFSRGQREAQERLLGESRSPFTISRTKSSASSQILHFSFIRIVSTMKVNAEASLNIVARTKSERIIPMRVLSGIRWTSTNNSVVTVVGNANKAVLKARRSGTATIRATFDHHVALDLVHVLGTPIPTSTVPSRGATGKSNSGTAKPTTGAPKSANVVPSEPTDLVGTWTLEGNDDILTLSWASPKVPKGERFTYVETGEPCALSGTTCAAKDLPAGSVFTFCIRAKDRAGLGPPICYVKGVIGPPYGVTSAALVGSKLTWQPPSNDNGGNVLYYELVVVEGSSEALLGKTSSLTYTVPTEFIGYPITITPVNDAGTGTPVTVIPS